MRNQQEIYIQTEVSALRNKTIRNVNMSSDFCIFKTPSYDIDNLISIQCDPSLLYLTGYSLNDIFISASTECFGSGGTACYCATTWTTKVYEDNVIKYNDTWYDTNTYNDIPTDTIFIGSIENAFQSLQYEYSNTGTTYQISKIFGVKELKIDVCVAFKSKSGATLSCPAGYVSNENNDGCQKILTASTTFNGTGDPILPGDTNSAYLNYGAYFYPNIQSNGALPVYYTGNFSDLKDQTGGTITALNINYDSTNTFFVNTPGNTTDGRLNQIGLSASTTEWVGFSKCLDIPFSGTYYVGIAADNNAEFYLNGELIVYFTASVADNFKKWSVFPLELKSGKNIIEMYGINDAFTSGAFAAEVYAPIDYQTLTGATSTGITGTNTIFSTIEFVGQQWQLGSTVGYSCPAGYSLDTCSTAYTCTQILRTGYTESCSGNCSDDCYEIATTNFQYIDNTSTGVYLIPLSGTTLIDTIVNFIDNLDELTSLSNLTFRYEIFKFNPNANLFNISPVFTSEKISYESYTGCVETYLKYAEAVGFGPESNPLTISESESIQAFFSGIGCSDLFIDFSNLSGDGDYLLKIFYEFDVCTDYLRRLGKKVDTSVYATTNRFFIYDEKYDKYFVGVYKAEEPILISSQQPNIPAVVNNNPVTQETIIVDNRVSYNSSGSTIPALGAIDGDIFVTLNGLVLSKGVDYNLIDGVLNNTLQFGSVTPPPIKLIQFYGLLSIGDIVTLFYTRTDSQTLVSNSILVDSTIPSGTTNNQGTNNYYFNTTTQKYEVYLDNTPTQNSTILLMLNGMMLSYNIDYYQSTSNKKRIILEGIIKTNDIVTIIYYPSVSVIDGITSAQNYISWYVNTPSPTDTGEFVLEYSPTYDFSTYFASDVVNYVVGNSTYSGILNLSGGSGTEWYYRVKNHKKYVSICGDIIDDSAYSEIVKVKITSNAINSY